MKKLIKINLKQKIALPAGIVLMFILCRPLMQLMTYENSKRFSQPSDLIERMESFFTPNFLYDVIPTAISAVLIAVVFFSCLFSKKKVDLYHSIPVNRRKLFTVNFVSGIIVYAIGMAAEFLVSVLIAIPNHYMTGAAFVNLLVTMLTNTVHFLYTYGVTVFAIMLTGNTIVAVLGTALISLYYAAAAALIGYFQSTMFVTYIGFDDIKEELLTKYSWLSPMTSHTTIANRFGWGSRAYENAWQAIPALIMPLIMAAAFTCFAYMLYMRRPSEAAGKALAFKKSRGIIEVPVVILGGLAGAWFTMSSISSFRTKWMWLGVALGVILVHCIIEIIFNESFKALFSHKLQLAVTLAVTAAILFVFAGDVTGFDKHIPDRESIASAAVYFNGIDENLSYMHVVEDPQSETGYSVSYSGGTYYTLSRPFTDEILIDKIYAISNIGVSCVDSMIAKRYETAEPPIMYAMEEAMVDPYFSGAEEEAEESEADEKEELSPEQKYALAESWMQESGITKREPEETDRSLTVDVCYTLKSGKVVLRRYEIPLSKIRMAMNEVYRTDEFNAAHFDVYEAYDMGLLYRTDVFDATENRVMTFTEADNKGLLDAYVKDLKTIDIDTISQLPIGRINPAIKTSTMYDDYYRGYYIYPEYTNTLDFLKKKGVDMSGLTTEIDPEKVSSISVCSYNLYEYEDGNMLYYDELMYTAEENPEVIKELVPLMKNSANMWSNELLINKYENGLGAEVSVFFSSDKGLQRSAMVTFDNGKLPERIQKDILVGIYEKNVP